MFKRWLGESINLVYNESIEFAGKMDAIGDHDDVYQNRPD